MRVFTLHDRIATTLVGLGDHWMWAWISGDGVLTLYAPRTVPLLMPRIYSHTPITHVSRGRVYSCVIRSALKKKSRRLAQVLSSLPVSANFVRKSWRGSTVDNLRAANISCLLVVIRDCAPILQPESRSDSWDDSTSSKQPASVSSRRMMFGLGLYW